MGEEERSELVDAITGLTKAYEDSTAKLGEVEVEMSRRLRLQRGWVIVLAAVVAMAIAVSAGFRVQDQARERDRLANEARATLDQRATFVQGCERGNDQRRTLAQIIEKSVVPQPAPANLSPELADLYRQGQERTTALRTELLSLPGVQIVDCQAVFPPPKTGKD